ncbi:DUF4230 domain-containing protein [Amphibiibacter pelophylacis]|uniref:DUF4230 domain-containing protein n=1 Tax=Amphibiibacter pelophylacis TaxID=1799477 RepID=A0ACC6P187_9BURK
MLTRFFALIGALAVGAALALLLRPAAAPPEAPAPPLIALEAMGQLVSVKVHESSVIEVTENIAQDIPLTGRELRFGSARALLVARGECLAGTDLRASHYRDIDATARTATLVLPQPGVISARVNHGPRQQGGSYFYEITGSGLEPFLPGSATRTKATDAALARAETVIRQACASQSVLESARSNALAVLRPLFAVTGWTVTLAWATPAP